MTITFERENRSRLERVCERASFDLRRLRRICFQSTGLTTQLPLPERQTVWRNFELCYELLRRQTTVLPTLDALHPLRGSVQSSGVAAQRINSAAC